MAFKVGNHPRHLIAIGGLTCGMMFSAYLRPLAAALDSEGISLVLILLTSSHQGWGMGSVDRDAKELHSLMQVLKKEHGSTGAVLLGFSTGCQDAVWYSRFYRDSDSAAPLVGIILQAPASDREWLMPLKHTQERIELAKAMMADGRGDEVLFRGTTIDGAAISARRWLSLTIPEGDDDMFSSDFTDEQLNRALSSLRGLATLMVISGDDEFVPKSVDKQKHAERMVEAAGRDTCSYHIVKGAKHSLEGYEDEAVRVFMDFVKSIRWNPDD